MVAFCFTFLAARVLVLLIMTHRIPNLYFYAGATHVHHLNYGIFLLSAVGAYLLFCQPQGKKLTLTALAYGVGLALTFDEFGMWLHLGGALLATGKLRRRHRHRRSAGVVGLRPNGPRASRFSLRRRGSPAAGDGDLLGPAGGGPTYRQVDRAPPASNRGKRAPITQKMQDCEFSLLWRLHPFCDAFPASPPIPRAKKPGFCSLRFPRVPSMTSRRTWANRTREYE
jgi:hypothetical protein